MFKYCVIIFRKGRGGARVFGVLLVLFVFNLLSSSPSLAYIKESGSTHSLNLDSGTDLINLKQTVNDVVGEVVNDLTPVDLFNTGTNLPLNLPLNPLNHVKGFSVGKLDNDTTDLDLTKFFSPSGVSTGDLTGILKGVAVLSIQIFIVVVQVVSGIVKGILEALNF